MKIIITTVQVPFVSGGAELHAQNLKKALCKAGHEAEIVTVPFMDWPLHLIEESIIAARLLDLSASWAGTIDLNIALRFPAYFIPHPNKVVWALHQYRSAYDLFDTEYSGLKNNIEGKRVQKVVNNADRLYLKEAKRIYANSKNVAGRMERYNEIHAEALYHPCPDMERFYCAQYDNYILMPSRISATKRQMLALEAMCRTKSDISLYIVGKADHPREKEQMVSFIKKHKLCKKVKYFDYVTPEKKLELYANAKAVLFVPVDEDYGYITLEAMAASKAVITCTDSGGPLEFIEDGKNGFAVQPDAQAIAERIDELAMSASLGQEMGRCSKKRLEQKNITWENVVRELTKK